MGIWPPSDATTNANFGDRVTMSPDRKRLLISAPYYDEPREGTTSFWFNVGAVFEYTRGPNGWVHTGSFHGIDHLGDQNYSPQFGRGVTAAQNFTIVGAYQTRITSPSSQLYAGAIYSV